MKNKIFIVFPLVSPVAVFPQSNFRVLSSNYRCIIVDYTRHYSDNSVVIASTIDDVFVIIVLGDMAIIR
ncbi:MAG: hypothetical protein ACYC49_19310 [Ignavibacteriaceae bacterium]